MARDEDRVQLKRRFADFLEGEGYTLPGQPGAWSYAVGLRDMYEQEKGDDAKAFRLVSRRLTVHEHHLREFDETLLRMLVQHPTESLPAFEDALKEFVKSGADAELLRLIEQSKSDELRIGLRGDFGRHEVSPRELTSPFLNKLVVVFGIVTKCSLVRPKLVRSVHYSDITRTLTTREYRDVTASSGAPTGSAYPTKDDNGNPLTTEYGLCVYRDNQMVTVQELPETAPTGQLPISTEIILEDDLVDKVKPGDRVSIVGVYKPLSQGKASGQTSGLFRAVMVGISVHKLSKEAQTRISVSDAREIKALSQRDGILSLLGASLAPSIYGHDTIKNGLVLQLFGGMEKNLENGTHLRGDINALLVGDPGVAKSQLLRAVMNVAPHSVSTTGRGSSGVGLTAAVTSDNETGEKRLEAGAMVLADRGVVCIDEFDKMSDQDRVAIHEVMEQQTVTIAKAGIHASLNARCSVLAAANPLYGSYDRSISVTRNVNLPDSLLSRFDMTFVVLDQMTDARDKKVALHVLKQHRYRPQGDDGRGAALQESIHDMEPATDRNGDEAPAQWLKVDSRLHAAAADEDKQVLTTEFLRKYVVYARRKYSKIGHVEIDPAAIEDIANYYIELRSEPKNRNFPVTARSLETLIRLATAHCKIRLDTLVGSDDVAVATQIMDTVMRKDIGADEEQGDEEDEGRGDDVGMEGARRGTADDMDVAAPAPNPADDKGGRSRKRKNRWAPAAPGQPQPAGADAADAEGADGAAAQEDDGEGSSDGGSDSDGDAPAGGAVAAAAAASDRAQRSSGRSAKRQATGAERAEASAAATAAVAATGLAAAAAPITSRPRSGAAAGGSGSSSAAVPAGGELSDAQKAVVHSEIGELFATLQEQEYTLALLQERLGERGLRVDDSVLANYMAWLSEHYYQLKHLYLPSVFWQPEKQTFFNDGA